MVQADLRHEKNTVDHQDHVNNLSLSNDVFCMSISCKVGFATLGKQIERSSEQIYRQWFIYDKRRQCV